MSQLKKVSGLSNIFNLNVFHLFLDSLSYGCKLKLGIGCTTVINFKILILEKCFSFRKCFCIWKIYVKVFSESG